MELRINDLNKTYANGVQALRGITLNVPSGMFGLLGPNGAGKSTLMRTIATLQEPDSGTIFLGDLDVLKQKTEVRKVLGYLPQEFGVYPRVDAETMLDHFAKLKGLQNARERKEVVANLLQRTNLYEVRKKYLGGYSGGMKQRFGIAQALLGNPRLIIVDVSSLCQNMAIINKGQVLLEGKPQEALDAYKGRIWKRIIEKQELPIFKQNFNVISHLLVGGKFEIHVFAEEQPDPRFFPVEASLEDVYFNTVRPE